jgi:hypothetical protein
MNVRLGEVKGCIGCHAPTDTAIPLKTSQVIRAQRYSQPTPPFQFQAKIWFKGNVLDEREE